MSHVFRDWTIKGRLCLMCALVAVCLAALLTLSLLSLRGQAAQTMGERKAKLRAAVETTYEVVARYGGLAEAGKMDPEQAKREAQATVRAVRYEQNEYLWINDLQPRMIVHPLKPELEGRDLNGYTDAKGKPLFAEIVRTVRSEAGAEGFVEYLWAKPGRNEAVRKLSFVKLYRPWGWVIGTGLYLDDIVDDAAAAMWRMVALTAVIVLLLGVAAVFVMRGVRSAISSISEEAKKLETAVGKGRLSTRAELEVVGPEFRGILNGMNETIDAFAKPMKVAVEYVERISQGDIPAPITEHYEGDFDTLKSSLNQLIEMVHMREADILTLAESARAGRLDERIDAKKYKGSTGNLMEGINGMLDAVVTPVHEATRVLQRLAQRDLCARVCGDYRGDHAKSKDAVNNTAQALHDALAQVAQAAEQVASASGQIATAAHSVADGASNQASLLEETSAALESMDSMMKQSTESAQQANALAHQAREAAAEGGTATEQMTGGMAKIKASAEGTSQIIKDINEIAFQTNLLALNAAVEAARAGDAGRGFAVVAEEVRSLALRSKEAANRTEVLIRQSVNEATAGELTAKRAANHLSAIVSSIGKVSDIVAEIATSSKEQAAGIDQVNQAVSDADKVTQQNAASSEESSTAANDLAGQARQLADLVATFQLARGNRARDRVHAQPHASDLTSLPHAGLSQSVHAPM